MVPNLAEIGLKMEAETIVTDFDPQEDNEEVDDKLIIARALSISTEQLESLVSLEKTACSVVAGVEIQDSVKYATLINENMKLKFPDHHSLKSYLAGKNGKLQQCCLLYEEGFSESFKKLNSKREYRLMLRQRMFEKKTRLANRLYTCILDSILAIETLYTDTNDNLNAESCSLDLLEGDSTTVHNALKTLWLLSLNNFAEQAFGQGKLKQKIARLFVFVFNKRVFQSLNKATRVTAIGSLWALSNISEFRRLVILENQNFVENLLNEFFHTTNSAHSISELQTMVGALVNFCCDIDINGVAANSFSVFEYCNLVGVVGVLCRATDSFIREGLARFLCHYMTLEREDIKVISTRHESKILTVFKLLASFLPDQANSNQPVSVSYTLSIAIILGHFSMWSVGRKMLMKSDIFPKIASSLQYHLNSLQAGCFDAFDFSFLEAWPGSENKRNVFLKEKEILVQILARLCAAASGILNAELLEHGGHSTDFPHWCSDSEYCPNNCKQRVISDTMMHQIKESVLIETILSLLKLEDKSITTFCLKMLELLSGTNNGAFMLLSQKDLLFELSSFLENLLSNPIDMNSVSNSPALYAWTILSSLLEKTHIAMNAFKFCRAQAREGNRVCNDRRIIEFSNLARTGISITKSFGNKYLVNELIATFESLKENRSVKAVDDKKITRKNTRDIFKGAVKRVIKDIKALKKSSLQATNTESTKTNSINHIYLKHLKQSPLRLSGEVSLSEPAVKLKLKHKWKFNELKRMIRANKFVDIIKQEVFRKHVKNISMKGATVLCFSSFFCKEDISENLGNKIIALYKSGNEMEIFYIPLFVWILCRSESNRKILGELGMVECLIADLKAYISKDTVKANYSDSLLYAYAVICALWMILHDPLNLEKFQELNGFEVIVQLLVYVLDENGKADKVGCVALKLQHFLATKALQSNIEGSLFHHIANAKLLEILWLCACSKNKQSDSLRENAAKIVIILPLPDDVAERSVVALIRKFVKNPNSSRIRAFGAKIFSQVRLSEKGFNLLRTLQIQNILVENGMKSFESSNFAELTATLTGLMYVTMSRNMQIDIARNKLYQLLQLAWNVKSPLDQRLVSRIISNLSLNPKTRTILYRAELRCKKLFNLAKVKIPDADDHVNVILQCANQKALSEERHRTLRDSFFGWFREYIDKEELVEKATKENIFVEKEQEAQNDIIPNQKLQETLFPSITSSSRPSTADSTLVQKMREPAKKLWTSSNDKINHWAPKINSAKVFQREQNGSNVEHLLVTIDSCFPQGGFLFKGSSSLGASSIGDLHTRRSLGIQELSKFKHVKGSKVYRDLDIPTYEQTKDSLQETESKNQGKLQKKRSTSNFFFQSTGMIIELPDSICEGFATPEAPTTLQSIGFCFMFTSNLFSEKFIPVEYSSLFNIDYLPHRFAIPKPVTSKDIRRPFDSATAADTSLIWDDNGIISDGYLNLRWEENADFDLKSSLTRRKSMLREWKMESSVFAPRMKFVDSNTFWNEDAVYRRAFDTDWRTCWQKENFRKLVNGLIESSNEVGTAQTTLNDLKAVLCDHYKICCNVFRYYSTLGNSNLCSMNFAAINQLCIDCQLFSEYLDQNTFRNICITIFSRGIDEAQLTRSQRLANQYSGVFTYGKRKSALRHDLIELIIRVAEVNYLKPNFASSIVEAINFLFSLKLKNLHKYETILDPDNFRKNRLYNEEVDRVLWNYLQPMHSLFTQFAGSSASYEPKIGPKGTRMTFAEWNGVLEHVGLLNANFTVFESSVVIRASQFEVIDTSSNWANEVSLSFYDFLEAMCRVADSVLIPDQPTLDMTGSDSIIDFYDLMNRTKIWESFLKDEGKHMRDQLQLLSWRTGVTARKKPRRIKMRQSRNTIRDNHSTILKPLSIFWKHVYDDRPLSEKLSQLMLLIESIHQREDDRIIENFFWNPADSRNADKMAEESEIKNLSSQIFETAVATQIFGFQLSGKTIEEYSLLSYEEEPEVNDKLMKSINKTEILLVSHIICDILRAEYIRHDENYDTVPSMNDFCNHISTEDYILNAAETLHKAESKRRKIMPGMKPYTKEEAGDHSKIAIKVFLRTNKND